MLSLLCVRVFVWYRQFPKEGIEGCNALVLTHDHADAILGLDDLRDLQHKEVHTHDTTQAALHTCTA
jgi:phosphoribosyl 1,2-cyclic phosphodiesterase